MIQLFFTGYKTPSKRYKSYFPNLDMIYDPPDILDNVNQPINVCAMTHSVGLINALIFYKKHESLIQRIQIVAIDPPDISDQAIAQQLNDQTLDHDLKQIYKQYIDLDIFKSMNNPVNIILYRNIKNLGFYDSEYYNESYYYQSDTHYPFMNKLLRNRILVLYEKNALICNKNTLD